jgi:magnesium-transporting ATPase (P-type)
MYPRDSTKMGSTVVRGEVEGTVEFTGADTFFGKTASLLQVIRNENIDHNIIYLLFNAKIVQL